MSVLSLPRIIVNGTAAWNPATNNNALAFGYNKDPVTVALPEGVTYDTFDDWLIEYDQENQTTNGDWNVFGQMQSWFEAAVAGTVLGAPASGSTSPEDPIVGGSLAFYGGDPKLVDVNAYSSVTSQVFLGSFGVEADGGVGFTGPATCRMSSRRPFFSRNVKQNPGLPIAGAMGVVWQSTIAKGAIDWGASYRSSPALRALYRAMGKGGVLGVMLRLSTYTTIYFTSVVDGGWIDQPQAEVYRALAERYQASSPIKSGNIAGVFNPARSTLVGAIGLWQEGELKTVPTERVLAAVQATSRQRVAAAAVTLGPAEALINPDAGVVSLDFQNTVPELDETNRKADVGSLAVQSRSATGEVTPIGTISPEEYGKDAYEQGGGIIDVPFDGDWDAIENGSLELVPAAGKATALEELPLYADTDDRGVYLDQNDEQTITIRVYARGGVPATETRVHVISNDPSVELAGGSPATLGRIVDVDCGVATIRVKARKPGNALILFAPFEAGAEPPPVPVSPQPTTGYAAVRVLSFDDDLAKTPRDQVTWDFVYQHVLRPFDLVYRGMSAGIFSLGDEQSVRANASAIEGFTSPGEFESPLYMPVTRDMSRGRRALLLRFLSSDEG